jgi:hypothetical protein
MSVPGSNLGVNGLKLTVFGKLERKFIGLFMACGSHL